MDSLTLTMEIIKGALNWRGLLDILFIAIGLLFAYHTLNRLKTWKILFGISLAVIILMVAHILELTGVRWIYSNFSNIALVGLIVVFQPEIRKMFERVASLRGSRFTGNKTELALLVAEAVFAMAAIKQGALLVFPGKEPAEQWMSGGFTLNGDLSLPLLMSIFDHHSPGHDGAATIEDGKVTHFGARLPLSKSDRLDENLGTRHHAAMGLSEVSDALVIVVSEERGSVSVFQNGKSEFVNARDELQAKMVSHWMGVASFKPGAAKKFSRWSSCAELAFGLVAAFLIWSAIIISQGEIIQKGIMVPITYTGLPKDLTLVEDKTSEVNLLLGGTKSDLDTLKPSQMNVKIDLAHAVNGKQNYLITQENVSLPKGIRLMGAEPAQLSLRLEPLVTREVSVKPHFVGKLPRGVRLLSATVNPAKVMVRCPANFAERAKLQIDTAPIDLTNVKEDTKIDSQIAAPPECQPVKNDWPRIEVAMKLNSNQ